jgi:hypothetical protein
VTTSPPHNPPGTLRLAELIRVKLKIIELLAGLARKQLALAESGDTGELIKLLAAKDTVLAQLHTIERQLDPFRAEDPEARVWLSPGERVRCQEHVRQCDELLAATMNLERQAEAVMLRRRDQAAEQLVEVTGAAAAATAYTDPTRSVTPMHLVCEG